MSVDPALWDAFYKAKDALLSALDASLTQPNCRHVLLHQLVERGETRTSIKRRLERLRSGIRELESAQADITRMHDRFLKGVGRVQSSLSPVGVLPPELLREVIVRSAGPQDYKRILALASVCDRWRTAVHAERSLWVDANWDSWPAPLLELWCSRVRGHPMTVRLGMKGIKSTSDEAYARILQSSKPFWDVLRVDLAHKRLAESRCVSASEFLFKDNLPSLRDLYFHMEMPLAMGFGATPRAILAPNVRDIKWRGSIPLGASESFTSLRSISFFPRNEIQWRKWLSIFSASSRLEHLEVDFRGTFGGVRPLPESPLPAATLPSLLSLTINSANPPDLRRGFQDVYILNLREIFLDDHLQPDHFSSTLARLSHMAPSTTSLRIDQSDCAEASRKLMDCLTESPSIFPLLEEITISQVYPDNFSEEISHDVIRDLVTARDLKKLEISGISESLARELESEFKLLKVQPNFYVNPHTVPRRELPSGINQLPVMGTFNLNEDLDL